MVCEANFRFVHTLLLTCAPAVLRYLSRSGWGADLAEFPELLIHDYESLVAALRAVKVHLGLSNETLEEIAGLARAHADKLLGPSRAKRIGPLTLGLLLGALGISLRVEVDLEAA
jgi:hypothetical protein